MTELQDALAHHRGGRRGRRRIERDLHDGAQQRLVALALNLRVAEQRAADGDPAAAELVGRPGNSARPEGAARPRARHPPGDPHEPRAAGRARDLAQATVPVEVVATPGERLPDPVEAAAYFVVSECLANIGKHAEASSATVAVSVADGLVSVEVADDGVGRGLARRGRAFRASSTAWAR